MKQILNQLFEHKKLSADQAKEVLVNISKEIYNPAQIAAFISVYLMRSISVEELSGFRSALLDLCIPVDLEERQTIDVCGTGGDGKNTFNISTTTAFVVAGAGYQVAKHGNYGVSSICGSSNVLESLGVRFSNDTHKLKKQLDEAGICFFHAPLFHPALKSVGPIRKQLGVKTFFNLLGPLVNPARPSHQLVGVFNLKVARLYQYLHEASSSNYTIIHAIDGYDEISLTGDAKLITQKEELLINPSYFGFKKHEQSAIFGGDTIEDAGKIFIKILDNEGSQAQNNAVVANASMAIKTFKPDQSIEDCVAEAQESIQSGRAKKAFKSLVSLSA